MSCMNQNLSVMGVASCRSTFLCLILRPSRASRFGSCVSWVSIHEVALVEPNPARPGPVRPWRPHPHMRPSSSPSLIWISRATTSSLPLPPLSPRRALGIGDGDHRNLDPEVSSPPVGTMLRRRRSCRKKQFSAEAVRMR
jgi:hypothetical protein